MARRFYCLSFIALSLLAVPDAEATHKDSAGEVALVADEWCPFTCNEREKQQGIMVEVVREAMRPHGITVTYRTLPWTRAIRDTRAGKYNAIVGASPEEAPDFLFPSNPQAVSHLGFFTRTGNPWRYRGVASLEQVSLGAVTGYSYNSELDRYLARHKDDPARVQLVYGEHTLGMNVKKLLSGRVDAVVEEELVFQRYVKSHAVTEKTQKAGMLPERPSDNLFVAFAPHNPSAAEYVHILEEETAKMMRSGRLSEIIRAYGVR